jgi:hypothetical protein
VFRSDKWRQFASHQPVNWAHAVGGQWGITNQKMKKGAEGTNTRGRLLR